MKKLLVLGCGLVLLSLCSFSNNYNEDLIFSTKENNNVGVSLRKANNDNEVEVGKTYVQSGQNDSHRLIRFATPVSGNFFSIDYHVSIEGYSDVNKEVSVVYKGLDSNGTVAYYNGSEIVNEKTSETDDWYWACFTIEFSTYNYVDANISAYITVNNEINSTKKENVSLKEEIGTINLDATLIGKYKDENNVVEVKDNYLIINDYRLNFVDKIDDDYVFYNGVNYLKIHLENGSLIVKGKLDVNNINLSLAKNTLIKCPVTFEDKQELTVGDEEIKFTVPEGVSYVAYYEQNEKKVSDYGTLPTEPGYYSLVVDTVETDVYEATHVWKTFLLNAKPSVEKKTLNIAFDFEAGTKFALGIAPTFKITDSEGNEVSDANINVNYTSDTTGYNSNVLPTEPGDYGITVTVNEDDKYNTSSKNVWFTVENRILTTISSSCDNIYSGTLENIIDKDSSSFCWFGTSIPEGDYIQIDYSYKKQINRLSYTFDANDYFKFKVQYLDNGEYVDCSSEVDGSTGVVSLNSTIETTSIRFVVTGNRGVWAKIFEMDLFFAPDVTNNGFTLVDGSNLNNLSDNSLETYTWFDWHYTASNNIVLDYGKTIDVNTITFLSGCYAHPGDVAGTMKFSYSEDGENYVDIAGEYEGINILVKLENTVKARYIKATPVLEGESGSGITIREFGVNLGKFDVSVSFSDDVAFTYDGEAHSPKYTVPYGINYTVVYNSEDLNKFNQTEAKDVAFWAVVITPEESEIYNFVGPLYKVFHIDAAE